VLEGLLADPYYDAAPPKSADASRFERLLLPADEVGTEDLLATVTELTAMTIAAAVRRWITAPAARILVSGGGVHNTTLMARLRDRFEGLEVESLAAHSAIPVDAKEAVAFALLGLETLARRPSNVPGATGAQGPAVLGKVAYPPPR
jgi:anhydro-N-acetylmuramic acid kinase